MEVDPRKFHPTHFADRLREHAGPTAAASAEDHLERFALAPVSCLVEKHRHCRFRLALPQVAVECAESHDAQSIQPNIAKSPLPDVPREDALAVVVSWRLSKGAGTRNGATAGVEPIALD